MSATRAQVRRSIARSAVFTESIRANASRTPTLRAAFGSSIGAAGKWNVLMPKGTYHGANLAPIGGSIVIDDAMLNEMVANWQAAGRPPLPIRKTHQHLDADPSPLERLELEKAYGFLTDMRVSAAGLEVMTEWNAAGKATVEAGEFAFWSPEWQPRHKDRRTGETKGWWLSGTALTNDPFFHEMPPVAASADDAESTDTNPNKEQHMFTPSQLKSMKAALKCAEDCSGDELYAAFEKKMSVTAAAEKSSEVVTAAVKSLRDEFEVKLAASNKLNEEFKAQLLDRDIDAAVAKAKLGDGKTGRAIPDALIASAKALAKHGGLKAATDLLDALPLSVPMAPVGSDSKPSTETAGDDRAKYDALVEEKVKAGASYTEAARLVASDPKHRDLIGRVYPRS